MSDILIQKTYLSARPKQNEKQRVRWEGGMATKFGSNDLLAHSCYNL